MLKLNRALPGVLLVLVLPFFILGCNSDEDDPDPAVSPRVESPTPDSSGPTVEPDPPDPTTDAPPPTTASANGTTVEMGVGTYCWTTMCVDMIGPITKDTLQVATGDEVIVAVPAAAPVLNEVSVEAFSAANPQTLDNGGTAWQPDFDHDGTLTADWDEEEIRIALPLEPGTYVLVVGMFFEAGDVQYGVVLEVK